jgi:hypothetical protein
MPSPLISPLTLLLIAMAVTVFAAIISSIERRRRQRALAQLAREWQMHYSSRDVFNLAPRLAPHLPIPGAADVRVLDLIYGSEQGAYCYLFSAEYTSGVIRSKRRDRCVLCVREPRDRDDTEDGSCWSSAPAAPSDQPLLEQYRAARAASGAAPHPSSGGPDEG